MSSNNRVKITCQRCDNEIRKNEDLVTTFHWFRVRPFHVNCITKWGLISFFGMKRPINSISSFIIALGIGLIGILLVGSVVVAFVADVIDPGYAEIEFAQEQLMRLFGGIVALIPLWIVYRSWVKYERPLRDESNN